MRFFVLLFAFLKFVAGARLTKAAFVASLASALLTFSAFAKTPSQIEFQLIEAVRQKQFSKSRDLIKLGNINPGDIAGDPLIIWVYKLGGHPDNDVLDFLFGELKQSYDATFDGNHTMLRVLCSDLTNAQDNNAFNSLVARIISAVTAGANVQALKNSGKNWASRQPFPTCLSAYDFYRANVERAESILKILDAMIKKGIDVNAYHGVYAVSTAAKNLDLRLLNFLVSHGAKAISSFPASDISNSFCKSEGLPTNNLIAYMPSPRDSDVNAARQFLLEFIKLGGDIKHPITDVFLSGDCKQRKATLKETALGLGQVEYAKMVLSLEGAEPHTGSQAAVDQKASASFKNEHVKPEASVADMMTLLIGVASSEPQTQTYTNINSFNEPVQKIKVAVTPRVEGPCTLAVNASRDVLEARTPGPLDHQKTTFIYDFTKLTSVTSTWTTDYEEGALAAIGQGPRKPRKYLEIKLNGAGAACFTDKSSKPTHCSDNFTPYWHVVDTRVTPAKLAAAFQRIKSACNGGATTASVSKKPEASYGPALVECPGTIASVEIEAEAGKFNPPALLAPSSDNGKTGEGFSKFVATWTGLAGQNAVMHCKLPGNKVVDVAVPAEATACIRSNNQVKCYGESQRVLQNRDVGRSSLSP